MHYSDIKRKYTFKEEDDWGCYDEKGCYHRGHQHKDGYTMHSWYCIDGKQHQLLEHRMKWEFFNGDIPDGVEVDHVIPISEGGTNKLSNLRLCSHKDNMNNTNSVRKMSRTRKGKFIPKQVRIASYEASIKKVIRKLDNGSVEEYESAKKASNENNFNYVNIMKACEGKYCKEGNYYKNSRWYYV